MTFCLKDFLIETIKLNGPIPVDTFIDYALWHPKGYYAKGSPIPKDYVTAPHISSLFGEIIGFWVLHQWNTLNKPSPFHLIELGPGNGTLMSDMLRVLEKEPMCFQSLSIHMIEKSPALKKIQNDTLLPFINKNLKVQWHNQWPFTWSNPICIVANEFFDALPVTHSFQCKLTEKERPRMVYVDQDELLMEQPNEAEIIVEKSKPSEDILLQIKQSLLNQTGSALIIDYGYDDMPPHQSIDTLQALYRHQKVSPLTHIGNADLTHHVNFQKLQSLLQSEPSLQSTLWTQGAFLKAMGFEDYTKHYCMKNPFNATNILLSSTRLIAPQEMGQLFKVLEVFYDGSVS